MNVSLDELMGMAPQLFGQLPSPAGIFGSGGMGFGTVVNPLQVNPFNPMARPGSMQPSIWDSLQPQPSQAPPLVQMMQPQQPNYDPNSFFGALAGMQQAFKDPTSNRSQQFWRSMNQAARGDGGSGGGQGRR